MKLEINHKNPKNTKVLAEKFDAHVLQDDIEQVKNHVADGKTVDQNELLRLCEEKNLRLDAKIYELQNELVELRCTMTKEEIEKAEGRGLEGYINEN